MTTSISYSLIIGLISVRPCSRDQKIDFARPYFGRREHVPKPFNLAKCSSADNEC
jgi:hypothetical protein